MGLSKMAEKCRECPFKDDCNDKHMESYAYMPTSMTTERKINIDGVDVSAPSFKDLQQKIAENMRHEIEFELFKGYLIRR